MFIEREVAKEMIREVVVNEVKVEVVEVAGETRVVENNNTDVEVQPMINYVEKVV